MSGNYVEDNTLTVYIKRLRKKLDTNMIKTVKGLGYRLEVLLLVSSVAIVIFFLVYTAIHICPVPNA